MKDDHSNQVRVLAPGDLAVDLLLNLAALYRFAPFVLAEQTLGSAASHVGIPPSSLAYWVKRFRTADLVNVVRHESRAGKPIPVYRSTAAEYVIPVAAMSAEQRDEFLHRGRRRLHADFAAAVDRAAEAVFAGGLRLSATADGRMSFGFDDLRTARLRRVTEYWSELHLTDAEADGLFDEIESLIARYGSLPTTRRRRTRYRVVMGMAPDPR